MPYTARNCHPTPRSDEVISPFTWSFEAGLLVPTPTFPTLSILRRSALFVASTTVPSAGEYIPPSVSPTPEKLYPLVRLKTDPPRARTHAPAVIDHATVSLPLISTCHLALGADHHPRRNTLSGSRPRLIAQEPARWNDIAAAPPSVEYASSP